MQKCVHNNVEGQLRTLYTQPPYTGRMPPYTERMPYQLQGFLVLCGQPPHNDKTTSPRWWCMSFRSFIASIHPHSPTGWFECPSFPEWPHDLSLPTILYLPTAECTIFAFCRQKTADRQCRVSTLPTVLQCFDSAYGFLTAVGKDSAICCIYSFAYPFQCSITAWEIQPTYIHTWSSLQLHELLVPSSPVLTHLRDSSNQLPSNYSLQTFPICFRASVFIIGSFITHSDHQKSQMNRQNKTEKASSLTHHGGKDTQIVL